MWNPMDSRGRQTAHRTPTDHACIRDDDPFDLAPLDGFPSSHEPPVEAAPFPTKFPFAMDEERHHDETDPFDVEGSAHSDEFVDAEAFMADHKPGEDSFLREANESGDVDMGWSDDEAIATVDANGRRASAIFVLKSRNMEKVEFSSPKRTLQKSVSSPFETPPKTRGRGSVSKRTPPSFSASNTAMSSEYDPNLDDRAQLTPNTLKVLQERDRLRTDDFSQSESNASMDDSEAANRSVHASQAIVTSATTPSEEPNVRAFPPRILSAVKAMHAGPRVIKAALHEFESLLPRPSNDESADSDAEVDPGLDDLTSRVRKLPASLDVLVEEREGVTNSDVDDGDPQRWMKQSAVKSPRGRADRMPVSDAHAQERGHPQLTYEHPVTAAARMEEFRSVKSERAQDGRVPESDARNRRSSYDHAARIAVQLEDSHVADKSMAIEEMGAVSVTSLEQRGTRPQVKEAGQPEQSAAARANKYTQATRHFRSVDVQAHVPARTTYRDEVETSFSRAPVPTRPKKVQHETNFRRDSPRQSLEATAPTGDTLEREGLERDSWTSLPPRRTETKVETVDVAKKKELDRTKIKANLNSLPLATTVPTQMARRCRRFLCTVGEHMREQIVFSNGTSKVGRICVSLLPLSTGCQQFSVTPAVLELQPQSRSAFTVTFDASRPGVVAGIFQFRAVGIDGLHEPYEVLIEASVRGDLQLSPGLPRHQPSRPPTQRIKSVSREPRVTELPARALAGVQITPTFLRFTKTTSEDGQHVLVSGPSIRITNTTTESVDFQVKSSYEHLQLSKARGSLMAGSEVTIKVQPICCPFELGDGGSRDWCGSMTVVVGDVLSREVSVVIDHKALAMLPTFDEAARVRQAISAQTDSFYYTKKVNRRGLYFHARAVECGSCVVGESHHVPVYICNGSDAPMTVFLQALQDPFSCTYQPTTLQARKFIEVPVTFTPKAAGKVATCLVAYTVTGKAAVTLIARGIDKLASTGPPHS